jgi:hypothetical protein
MLAKFLRINYLVVKTIIAVYQIIRCGNFKNNKLETHIIAMKKILSSFFILFSLSFMAQEKCATTAAYHKYLQDPVQQQALQMAESKAREWLSNAQNQNAASLMRNSVIRIPVVVHVLYKNAAQNIPDSLIHSQIQVLNECFRKQNPNYANTRAIFDTLGADTEIEFCLAAEDPAGYPTTGIIRKQAPSNAQFDPLFGFDNMKKPSKGGDTAWANTTYLNIWVGDMSIANQTFVLGYATFPGAHPALDGIVIQFSYFGKYSKQGFLGKTTVHEVGHWLGMRHIWADDDNVQNPQTVYCDSTDFVDDTPNAGPKSNSNCDLTKNTCSAESAFWGNLDPPDMVENYMDYSSDACMTMFTKGQKARMYSFLSTDPARLAITTSTALCQSPVGLLESETDSRFTVYPVPAQNSLTVKIVSGKGTVISMLSSDGRLMLLKTAESDITVLDVSNCLKGFYFLKIENSKHTVVKKVLLN